MASKPCTGGVNVASIQFSVSPEHHRLNRVWPRADLHRRTADNEGVWPTTRCRVHDHDRHRAVLVDEGRAEQHAAARGREQAPGTGSEERRGVAYAAVVLGGGELPATRHTYERCEAKLAPIAQ